MRFLMVFCVGAILFASSVCAADRQSGAAVSKSPVKKSPIGVEGAERASVSQFGGNACYIYDSFTVISRAARGSVGSDTLVKAGGQGSKTSCKWEESGALMIIRNRDAEYFFGISGSFLFIDSGTGADSRTFMVYDLGKKKKVFSSLYSGVPVISGNVLLFWIPSGAANKAGCPDYDTWTASGLSVVKESEVRLDLLSMEHAPTGRSRCSARQ